MCISKSGSFGDIMSSFDETSSFAAAVPRGEIRRRHVGGRDD